jgi:hypothetical protein
MGVGLWGDTRTTHSYTKRRDFRHDENFVFLVEFIRSASGWSNGAAPGSSRLPVKGLTMIPRAGS